MREREIAYVKMVDRRKSTQGVKEKDIVIPLAVGAKRDKVLREIVSPNLVIALCEIRNDQMVVVTDRRY